MNAIFFVRIPQSVRVINLRFFLYIRITLSIFRRVNIIFQLFIISLVIWFMREYKM